MTMKPFIHLQTTGMTLVELMLTLAIASVLMLGVTSIYITSKRAHQSDTSLARQQENSRFTLGLLIHDLRMAGYPGTVIRDALVPAGTRDGGGKNNDSISIQYESDTDCLGQTAPVCSNNPVQQCAVNRYYIAPDPASGGSNLYCLGNGGDTARVIASNVTNLQILYGVDTDSSRDGIANKYVRWDHVTKSERASIVSVRFALLTRSPKDVLKTTTGRIYRLLDRDISFNDRRVHRVFANTVVLRNRIQ